MQKRHFEMIAGCVARSRMAVEFIDRNAKRHDARLNGIRSVAIDLAATLGHDNPAFDKARFMKACGFSADPFASRS